MSVYLNRTYSTVRYILGSLSLSVPLTVIFFDNVAYVAKVEGVSMQPTLNNFDQETPRFNPEVPQSALKQYFFKSEFVLLSHWATRNYQIKRGDVVSLVSPKNPNQVIIKRVVALEGDMVVARPHARRFESIQIQIPKVTVVNESASL